MAELAHHAIAGSDFESALTYGTRAGDWAMALLAYEEAEWLYKTALEALELVDRPDERRRCDLLLSLGGALARAGNSAGAQGAFVDAANIARRIDLGRELARAAAGYGGRTVWARAGKDARLIPLLDEGLTALPEGEDELRVQLLARLAGALRDEASIERRDELSRQAVAVARHTDSAAALAYALESRGAAAFAPGFEAEYADLARELSDIAERIGDLERSVSSHYYLFNASLHLGDIQSAEVELAHSSVSRGCSPRARPERRQEPQRLVAPQWFLSHDWTLWPMRLFPEHQQALCADGGNARPA